jgi:nucleoside-diphosphate-sugar epimerase
MRVLVFGGNRYIGLHLVFDLARRGHDVTVVNSHVAALPEGATRLHADRRQPGALEEVLRPHRDEFDVVFDNTAYVVDDVQPLVELFHGRIEQYIFTSSVAVYRRSEIQPVQETFPVYEGPPEPPARAYAAGKVATERYLFGEHARDGFPATSVRVTHTVGPMSPLGSREPAFFARLEQGRPILIPGDGYPFVHLIHVNDAARMIASMAGNPKVVGQIYNCAGREVTSVAGCMRLMAKAAGVEARIVNVPLALARTFNPPLIHWGEAIAGGVVFSVEKALADLEWEPEFGLEAAYKDSYDWFVREGRDRYEFDFSRDDQILARLEG